MNLDQFFNRKYDKDKYNCAHFVREVWLEAAGEDLRENLDGLLAPAADRRAGVALRRKFVRLQVPGALSVALMLRPRTEPHVGLQIDGSIFHISQKGVEFMPTNIACRGFRHIHFYTPCKL